MSNNQVWCERCQYCKYPRTSDDNCGACKCKLMKFKTIDVYVGGGETPTWCPLLQAKTKRIERIIYKDSNGRFNNLCYSECQKDWFNLYLINHRTKHFKTLAGGERFMKRSGYEEIRRDYIEENDE